MAEVWSGPAAECGALREAGGVAHSGSVPHRSQNHRSPVELDWVANGLEDPIDGGDPKTGQKGVGVPHLDFRVERHEDADQLSLRGAAPICQAGKGSCTDLNPEGPSLYVSTGIIRFDHTLPNPFNHLPPTHTQREPGSPCFLELIFFLRLYLVAWRDGDPRPGQPENLAQISRIRCTLVQGRGLTPNPPPSDPGQVWPAHVWAQRTGTEGRLRGSSGSGVPV